MGIAATLCIVLIVGYLLFVGVQDKKSIDAFQKKGKVSRTINIVVCHLTSDDDQKLYALLDVDVPYYINNNVMNWNKRNVYFNFDELEKISIIPCGYDNKRKEKYMVRFVFKHPVIRDFPDSYLAPIGELEYEIIERMKRVFPEFKYEE